MINELKNIKTTECKCPICRSFCTYRPCFGTPEDIKKLIEAGYAKRLMLDWWSGEQTDNEDVLIVVPAVYGHEGSTAPFNPIGNCVFYTKDKLCEIHDLKPLGGKIASHDKTEVPFNELIAASWMSKEGDEVIKLWRNKTGCNMSPDAENVNAESLSDLLLF